MKNIIFILCLVGLLSSCSNEDDGKERYIMKDGIVVYTTAEVSYYETLSDFRSIDANEVETRGVSIGGEINWMQDSIYGYNRMEAIGWEKAKFGSWIKNYGLSTDSVYFVSTLRITKFIPATSEDWVLPGEYFSFDSDSIGFCIPKSEVGFVVDSSISYGYYEAVTYIKCISYNGDGMTVGCYVTAKPENLKWKYFITKIRDIW